MLARYARHMRPGAELLGATALTGTLIAMEDFAVSRDIAACQRLTEAFAQQVAKTHTAFHSVVEELDVVPTDQA